MRKKTCRKLDLNLVTKGNEKLNELSNSINKRIKRIEKRLKDSRLKEDRTMLKELSAETLPSHHNQLFDNTIASHNVLRLIPRLAFCFSLLWSYLFIRPFINLFYCLHYSPHSHFNSLNSLCTSPCTHSLTLDLNSKELLQNYSWFAFI